MWCLSMLGFTNPGLVVREPGMALKVVDIKSIFRYFV